MNTHIFLTDNTCFAVPLNKPRHNGPSQNHYYRCQEILVTYVLCIVTEQYTISVFFSLYLFKQSTKIFCTVLSTDEVLTGMFLLQ